MKPVRVSIDVPRRRKDVYDFLDVRWCQAPLGERLAAPLVRAFVHRGTDRAMRRLADRLAAHPTAGPGGQTVMADRGEESCG